MSSAAGADRSDADIRCPAMVGNCLCRVITYSASTFDETVAMPAARIVHSSEGVSFAR